MNREILRLAVPNIVSNITVPLLSTVDTALMGHLSAVHLGAVGIGSMIFNFLYWNFGFLRMGTTGMTAQAYGKSSPELISQVFWRSFSLAFFIAILLLLFQYPLLQAGASLLNVGTDQAPLVGEYFKIRIWAAPATLLLYSALGWFFGMQNAIWPLLVTVIINVTNIILSLVLVRYFDMGIRGVAFGTVYAQYIGLAAVTIILFLRYRSYLRDVEILGSMKWERWIPFLRVNRDLFIRTVSLTFAFGFFYSQSSVAGTVILAANVILLQFLNWMSYGIDGFAFASESLVGKYVGAGKSQQVKRAVRLSFWWGGGLAIAYSLLFAIWGGELVSLFTKDAEVTAFAISFLPWLVIMPVVGFVCYIWDGIFIGFTASSDMRDSMFIALAFYLGFYFIIYTFYSNAIWISFLVFLAVRGILQTVYWIYSPRFRLRTN